MVRIAPNELSFTNKSVIPQLYSQTTEFMKTSRYDNFAIPPPSIFVMQDKQRVRERRRYLSPVFSWSYLQKMEPVIWRHLRFLIDVIDRSVGKPFPIQYWFRLLAVDIIGFYLSLPQLILAELSFGESYGALESGRTPDYVHDSDDFFLLANLNISFYWLGAILRRIPLSKLKHFCNAQERLAAVSILFYCIDVSMAGRNLSRTYRSTAIRMNVKISSLDFFQSLITERRL